MVLAIRCHGRLGVVKAADGVVECLEGCKIQDGVPLSNAYQTKLPASMTAGGRAVWGLHVLDDVDVWHTVMTRAR